MPQKNLYDIFFKYTNVNFFDGLQPVTLCPLFIQILVILSLWAEKKEMLYCTLVLSYDILGCGETSSPVM